MVADRITRIFHAGKTHELLLWSRALCADCRNLKVGRCTLFDVAAGARPAVCLAAEGEATARRNRDLAELAKRESQR
jgi:hypothetical protein